MKKETLDHYYKNVLPHQPKSVAVSLPLTLVQNYLFNTSCNMLEKECDLSHSELDVLAALMFNGKTMRPTELYEATIFSSGGMTKILKKLEEKRFVSRIASEEDKRSMLVHIEPTGEKIVLEAINKMTPFKESFFEYLDEEEFQALKQILKKLAYKIFNS